MELSELPPEESVRIEAALGELGDRYLKPLLRKVYGEAGNDDKDAEKLYEKLRMARIRYRRFARGIAG